MKIKQSEIDADALANNERSDPFTQDDVDMEWEATSVAKELEFIYDRVHTSFQNSVAEYKNTDEELNMMLVFNAALFILLTVIFPIDISNNIAKTAVYVFLILFGLSEIATISMILIALFPSRYIGIDVWVYTQESYFNNTLQGMYENELDWELNSTNALQNMLIKKRRITLVAIMLSIANAVFVLIPVIIGGFY